MVMSTPLSSLKKSRRPPFRISNEIHHSNPTSPRNIPLSPIDAADDELSALADDVASHMATQRLKETRKMLPPLLKSADRSTTTLGVLSASGNSSSDHTRNPGQTQTSDFELMSIMMSKITQLERRIHEQSVEIGERDQRIQLLQEKLRLFQRARSPERGDQRMRINDLEKKCLLLQQQVYEMENYLADYGLIWVGESDLYEDLIKEDEDLLKVQDDDDDSGQLTSRSLLSSTPGQLWQPGSSLIPDFKMNYDLVVSQIQELNIIAGADEAKVEHTGSGMARLKRPDPVSLTLFANGIVMFDGPFRPFTDATTQQCMRDIMDGFFPSELEKRFPDGVPFAINDKRNVYYKSSRDRKTFQGTGQRLGGTRSTSVLVEKVNDKEKKGEESSKDPAVQHNYTETTTDLPGRRLTFDQFLNHLPSSVIREGKVIDIRNSVKDTMLGREGDGQGPIQCTVVDTPSVRELQERVESGRREARTVSGSRVATVRVKSENGRHTFLLRMKFDESIGDLKAYLDAKRPVAFKDSYDILSNFPRRVLSDDSKTLEDCGLVPNSTVYLRKRC